MTSPDQNVKTQRDLLDQQTREMVQWHFGDDTGCDFWLEKKKTFNFDPLKDVNCFDDLKKFPLFEDDWLRGGPMRRWVPKQLQDKPIYVFETGGTTGVPKSRVVVEDHWIDYELFSATLPDDSFPRGQTGSCWGHQDLAACVSPSNIWRSSEAASVSAWTWILAGW